MEAPTGARVWGFTKGNYVAARMGRPNNSDRIQNVTSELCPAELPRLGSGTFCNASAQCVIRCQRYHGVREAIYDDLSGSVLRCNQATASVVNERPGSTDVQTNHGETLAKGVECRYRTRVVQSRVEKGVVVTKSFQEAGPFQVRNPFNFVVDVQPLGRSIPVGALRTTADNCEAGGRYACRQLGKCRYP